MSFSDFRIKSMVKTVLVRHWVDIHRIRIECFRGNVHLKGELCQLKRRESSENTLLEKIEREIRRLPGVRKVYLLGLTVRT